MYITVIVKKFICRLGIKKNKKILNKKAQKNEEKLIDNNLLFHIQLCYLIARFNVYWILSLILD